MEPPEGNCLSPSASRRGQLPLAYPRPSHSMSLRSHDWAPQPSESPATPGTSLFERAMRRSINASDQTPSPDGIRDGNYESFSDSFQTSPCARLSHSSLFLLEENTPTGPTLGSVWENSPNPNSGWHFDIREDQPEKKSPSPSTPRSYGGIDEDKENILPSDSDHEALSQTQAQVDNAGPNGLNNIQQDAFGFEIFHYADALAELPVNRYGYPAPPASIFAYDPVPASPTRSPEQMEVDEEDESRREHRADWRRVLDEDQIRELQRLSEVFSSGLEQRGLHNLPYTMAEQRFLGDSDFFMEDRRGTEQQSRRTRGPNF